MKVVKAAFVKHALRELRINVGCAGITAVSNPEHLLKRVKVI